jgi:hypothetical protein
MCCYFLHQETHAQIEEHYEAQLEKERDQHSREMHNLSVDQDNVQRN